MSYQGLQHHLDYSSLDRFENLAEKRGEYLVRIGLIPRIFYARLISPRIICPTSNSSINEKNQQNKVTSAARVQASKEVQSYSLKK